MGLLAILGQLVLLGIVSLVAFLFYKVFQTGRYFKKRGIPYLGGGYGRLLSFMFGRISFPDMELLLYQDSAEKNNPITGYLDAFTSPGVYIQDLDLARHVYVKDFDHFVNRRGFGTQKDELFQKMFLMMEGDQWKGMRAKLSPTFTTGKIRRMFNIFGRSSDRLCDYLRRNVGTSGGDVDMNMMYNKYAMDVIASCVFGIDNKTFENELEKLTEFEKMGKLLQFTFNPLKFIKIMFVLGAPKLANMLGIKATDDEPQRYFQRVIQQVLKHRRETGERQDDFLQLMMDVQTGMLKEENQKEVLEVMTGAEGGDGKGWGESEANKLTFDDDHIAANCVLFLLAGFDTLQTVLIYSAYALAVEQEVQEKLLEEVNASMEENGGKLTYDAIHEMKYLDMFVNETLRCFPPGLRTERMCTRDYPVPGTNAVIEKGVIVSLPILGVHLDSTYYENPKKFDPERFLPDRKAERHPYSFAPFGHGPRNCIGMRFALTEVKTVICYLVKNFKLEPGKKTEIPMKFGSAQSLRPANGMWVRLCPRSGD